MIHLSLKYDLVDGLEFIEREFSWHKMDGKGGIEHLVSQTPGTVLLDLGVIKGQILPYCPIALSRAYFIHKFYK